MNIKQILLLKLQRFNHKYGIPFNTCMHIAYQNWETNLVHPVKDHPNVLSTEEALSNLYQNNQLLLLTEEEILQLISLSLVDVNHVSCEQAQKWFDTNYDRYIYSYYFEELAKIIHQQMINKEIIIYEVDLVEKKPLNAVFENMYYNREGIEFAKSLK